MGNKVYLSSRGLISTRFIFNIIPRYLGPFNILASNPLTCNYTLSLPPHLRIHPTFHSSRLRPFFPNDTAPFPPRAFAELAPVIAGTDAAESEWELEKIVAVKTVRKKRVFKVRYKGYSEAADEWCPEAELAEGAPVVLYKFLVATALLGLHERLVCLVVARRGRVLP